MKIVRLERGKQHTEIGFWKGRWFASVICNKICLAIEVQYIHDPTPDYCELVTCEVEYSR